MNHCFACQKDGQGQPACKQWCGRPDLCLSSLTYHEEYMQTAYERGQRDGLEAAAKKCEEMGNGTSPHRRVAAEDMAYAIRKLGPRHGGQVPFLVNYSDSRTLGATVPLPPFDDPRVQAVYAILCDDAVPPHGEHWEGFAAKRVVAALSVAPSGLPEIEAAIERLQTAAMNYAQSPAGYNPTANDRYAAMREQRERVLRLLRAALGVKGPDHG